MVLGRMIREISRVWIQPRGKATRALYDRIRKAQNAFYVMRRRVYANPNVESDVKNTVFKATVLPIPTCGISNFNLPDHNTRALEA